MLSLPFHPPYHLSAFWHNQMKFWVWLKCFYLSFSGRQNKLCSAISSWAIHFRQHLQAHLNVHTYFNLLLPQLHPDRILSDHIPVGALGLNWYFSYDYISFFFSHVASFKNPSVWWYHSWLFVDNITYSFCNPNE